MDLLLDWAKQHFYLRRNMEYNKYYKVAISPQNKTAKENDNIAFSSL